MNRTAISLLALTLFASSARADLTINGLGAGGAVSGTDIFPAYQGANPAVGVTANQIKTFAAGSVTLVSTLTASASASLAWTGLTGNEYILRCRNLIFSSGTANIGMQFGEGGTPTWETTGYYGGGYASSNGFSTNNLGSNAAGMFINAAPNTGTLGVSGTWNFHALATSGVTKNAEGIMVSAGSGGPFGIFNGYDYTGDTNVITAIRILDIAGAGTITSGVCSLYAVAG